MQLRLIVICGLLVGALGCGDRNGLNPGGDDAGAGKGGAGGTSQGGAGGLAQGGTGGSKGGAGGIAAGGAGGSTMCGPVCDIYCPYGNATDAQGCALCKCNPPPTCAPVKCMPCPYGSLKDANGCDTCQCIGKCPSIACPAIYCEFGSPTDPNGCPTCGCNPPPVCDAVACNLYCANGFQKDARGCSVCACNPTGACSAAECSMTAPPPVVGGAVADPVAPPRCTDGSIPKSSCERDKSGICRWNYNQCPADCGQIRDAATCGSVSTCVWLQPGCSEPSIPTAGCYARGWLGCGDGLTVCPAGKQCQKRTVNPCTGTSAGGSGGSTGSGGGPAPTTGAPADKIAPPGMTVPAPPVCQVCAQPISICL
jgi:hypothetical protein